MTCKHYSLQLLRIFHFSFLNSIWQLFSLWNFIMIACFGFGDGERKVKNYKSIKFETLVFKQFQSLCIIKSIYYCLVLRSIRWPFNRLGLSWSEVCGINYMWIQWLLVCPRINLCTLLTLGLKGLLPSIMDGFYFYPTLKNWNVGDCVDQLKFPY